ncbi:MAG: DUF4491 family protein [Rikenellaceae bacterium]
MNFEGLIIGISTFLIIGMFHPIVIKYYYYFGTRGWGIFLLVGFAAIAGSLYLDNTLLSSVLGVFAFSSFWSIGEIFEQRKRVEKGWFADNPKRKKKN